MGPLYFLYGLYASLAGFLCQRQALHWSCLRRRRWGPLLTMVGGLIDLGLCSLDRIQDKKSCMDDNKRIQNEGTYIYTHIYISKIIKFIYHVFYCIWKVSREGRSCKNHVYFYTCGLGECSFKKPSNWQSFLILTTNRLSHLGKLNGGRPSIVLNKEDPFCMQPHKSIPLL